jgi:AcrR family transcriptional regulator
LVDVTDAKRQYVLMSGGSRPADTTESRERILSSAARVFAAYGFRHATFEEIAAGAGVSRTLLYRYFDGKVDLLRAVRDRALSAWADSVDEAAVESGTATRALEATIGETLRFASTRPDFRAFLSGDTRLALHGEPGGGGLSRQVWRDETAAILAHGVSTGEFPADLDIRASAEVLCAMQLGVIEQMHQVTDTSLMLGSGHLEAACRILVGGVTSSPGVPMASGVRS